MPKIVDPEIVTAPPPAMAAKPFRWSRKTIAFCMAVGVFAMFWLAGQLSTLRWQLHHVHSDGRGEIRASGRSGPGAP